MAPKKVKSESSSVMKRQRPTTGLKKEIISKYENGVCVSDLAWSTTCRSRQSQPSERIRNKSEELMLLKELIL